MLDAVLTHSALLETLIPRFSISVSNNNSGHPPATERSGLESIIKTKTAERVVMQRKPS